MKPVARYMEYVLLCKKEMNAVDFSDFWHQTIDLSILDDHLNEAH